MPVPYWHIIFTPPSLLVVRTLTALLSFTALPSPGCIRVAFDSLHADNYRVIPCFLKDPDYAHPTTGLWCVLLPVRVGGRMRPDR
jgi:hypothetical protein